MVSTIIISVLIFVNIFFLLAVVRKNFSIIDIGWGLGFILIASVSFLKFAPTMKNAVMLMVVLAWGTRLALYIFLRSRGKPEDHRYAKFREEWRPHPNLHAYFKVFIFQGILMMIVTLPVSVGMSLEKIHMSALNIFGAIVWMTGFTLEIISDNYLNWWKTLPTNKGKICTSGPWTLCRFPNYFGEVLSWYGVYLIAFEPSIWWTIVGPMTINFMIVKVTGVPLLEAHYKNRPEYAQYASQVPRFIPFFGKRHLPT